MTIAQVTQTSTLALTQTTTANVRTTQSAALALTQTTTANVRTTQTAILVLALVSEPPTPPTSFTIDIGSGIHIGSGVVVNN